MGKPPTCFPEGIILEFVCQQDTSNDTQISAFSEVIVTGSNLTSGKTHKYDFQIINSTTSIFVIKNLSRDDEGEFYCKEGTKTKLALIDVTYSPSDESPFCVSNYNSPVIYDDIREDKINFTCTTEEGDPPVLMTLNIIESNSTANITDIESICNVHRSGDNNQSFSCHLNESLENATFVCKVTQQLPSPCNVDYHDFCFFGPLHFLSNFSVTIFKSNLTVNEGDDLKLKCSTNVAGVEIKWDNIPKDWNYVVKTTEYTSHLEIYNVNQQSTSQIIVQCIGSYGNRNMTDNVKIVIVDVKGKGKVVAIVIIICSILGICGIIFALGYFGWKKKFLAARLSSDNYGLETTEANVIPIHVEKRTANTNNANNTAIEIFGEYGRCNSDSRIDQREGEEVSTMCDNPVYESASKIIDTMILHKPDEYAAISKQNQ